MNICLICLKETDKSECPKCRRKRLIVPKDAYEEAAGRLKSFKDTLPGSLPPMKFLGEAWMIFSGVLKEHTGTDYIPANAFVSALLK